MTHNYAYKNSFKPNGQKIPITYANAYEMSDPKFYEVAREEGWLDDWETAAEHVRLADHDLLVGIISSVTEYDSF